MATFPVAFPPLPSQQIASFDFFDLASGRAYKRFDAVGTNATNAGTSYMLTTETLYGGTTSTYVESGSTEVNFDTSDFSYPLDVEGDCYIHVPNFIVNDTATNPQTETAVVTVVVYHVDAAAAETSLGTDFYTNTASLSAGAYQYSDTLFKIALSKKHFAPGEKLRLSVTINMTGGAGDCGFSYNPVGTVSVNTYQTSRLTVDIPFDSKT